MSEIVRPITALLLSTAIVLMGNGLQTVLLPVRAESEAFTALQIGIMGMAYFGGLLAGCFVCPAAVARVGHVRAFTAFTAIATLSPLVHAIHPDPAAWWGLRFLTGVCFAGLIMVIESWLNGAATNKTRGMVLSIYTVINMTVVAAGQLMLILADPRDFQLFSLVAILISLAAVPVALSRAATPHVPRTARLRLGWLYRISPVGMAGCLVTGLANGAFWSMGPVFAARAGLSVTWIAFFMTAAVLGGALFQWPAGTISDRTDRRRVILVMAAVAVVSGILLSVTAGRSAGALLVLAGLYGGATMPIYAVSMAHANDFVEREDVVDVSSGLLLTYAAGAVAGPLIASVAMEALPTGGLFAYTAIVHAGFVGFVALRMRERAAPADEQRDDFVSVPRTTPAVFNLNPRTVPEGNTAESAPVDAPAT